MGGSGKWIKYFVVNLKKQNPDCYEKSAGDGKSRKWKKLWRSSSWDHLSLRRASRESSRRSAASDASETSSLDAATAIRAPSTDFGVVRQEWAAVHIQTAFRAFMARRALRALRGIVRLQAIVRGRQVRKQAAVTLRCMQALVRVQARIRARCVRMSTEGQAVQRMLEARRGELDPLKEAEEGWCDSPGTLEEVRTKLHKRRQGAAKRERVIAYALSQPQCRPAFVGRPKQTTATLKNHGFDKSSGNWSWLERWMAAKPWENRLMGRKIPTDISEIEVKEDDFGIYSAYTEPALVKVKKNNVSTRISARPPTSYRTRSTTSLSTEFYYNESSESSSSLCISTPISSSTLLASEKTEDINRSRPSYMNLTESIKAKQKDYSLQKTKLRDARYHRKTLSSVDMKSMDCSIFSGFSCNLENALPQRGRNSTTNLEKENLYRGK
ncbi:hypothetical protein Cni_G17880 [Canna indica]|uniref:Uncharacterized protein n=1 Tax=Canna indica TaxID=4628 RepID=A0AAQ3KJL6_9LILI|nr:hypothetical protein Cni_G17880 [Canna indica]